MFRFILQQQGTRTCCSSLAAIRLPRLTTTSPHAVTTNNNTIYPQTSTIPRLVDLGRSSASSSTTSTTSSGGSVNDQLDKLFVLFADLKDNFSTFENETKQCLNSMNENFSRLESETKKRLDSVNEDFSRLENETKKGVDSVHKNLTNLERKHERFESRTRAKIEEGKFWRMREKVIVSAFAGKYRSNVDELSTVAMQEFNWRNYELATSKNREICRFSDTLLHNFESNFSLALSSSSSWERLLYGGTSFLLVVAIGFLFEIRNGSLRMHKFELEVQERWLDCVSSNRKLMDDNELAVVRMSTTVSAEAGRILKEANHLEQFSSQLTLKNTKH